MILAATFISFSITTANENKTVKPVFPSFHWHWMHIIKGFSRFRSLKPSNGAMWNTWDISTASSLACCTPAKQHGIHGGNYLLKTSRNAISKTIYFKISKGDVPRCPGHQELAPLLWVPKPTTIHCQPATLKLFDNPVPGSLRASSPIWASEASLARTRERAAKPRGAEERRACNDLSQNFICTSLRRREIPLAEKWRSGKQSWLITGQAGTSFVSVSSLVLRGIRF